MSKVVERVRAYPSQYMWSMKRFKNVRRAKSAGIEQLAAICG
jgi:lauroyl/myristoyl acyltransferase